jgi:hypothetical protein
VLSTEPQIRYTMAVRLQTGRLHMRRHTPKLWLTDELLVVGGLRAAIRWLDL